MNAADLRAMTVDQLLNRIDYALAIAGRITALEALERDIQFNVEPETRRGLTRIRLVLAAERDEILQSVAATLH